MTTGIQLMAIAQDSAAGSSDSQVALIALIPLTVVRASA
jgi:hypothetical protein